MKSSSTFRRHPHRPHHHHAFRLLFFTSFFILTFLSLTQIIFISNSPSFHDYEEEYFINPPPPPTTQNLLSSSSSKTFFLQTKQINIDLIRAMAVPAYILSLYKNCNSKFKMNGFYDGAAVLRHSIHVSSTKGKYGYKLYAMVHSNCEAYAARLNRLGYEILLIGDDDDLFWKNATTGNNHEKEEEKEWIRLYAYKLTDHPILVHLSIDAMVLRYPLDDLFDAMLFMEDSKEGKSARRRLHLRHPNRTLADPIDAFVTRDSSSAASTRNKIQSDFWVSRSNPDHFEEFVSLLRRSSQHRRSTVSDLITEFYDRNHPGTAVELDGCVWNRAVTTTTVPSRPCPNLGMFSKEKNCTDDCNVVMTTHFTSRCKAPWECFPPHDAKRMLNSTTNTCRDAYRYWLELRKDYETLRWNATHNGTMLYAPPKKGRFYKEYFGGVCKRSLNYVPMVHFLEEEEDVVVKMYGMKYLRWNTNVTQK